MQYNVLASQGSINKTADSLRAKGYEVFVAENGAEALAKIKELIPQGVSVTNGASVTLEQIGFIDLLKSGIHDWNNLHEAVLAEKDPAKKALLRKQATQSDYYLGSVHALTELGEFVIASNTGSQLTHIVFTSQNLIFVVGAQKIVPTLDDAMQRLKDYVVPLEDQHMKDLYGAGTMLSKIVIFRGENKGIGRKIRLILIKEQLGF